MTSTYTQCLLAQAAWRTVAWIPSEAAFAGETLTLKGLRGSWIVLEAWGVQAESKIVGRHRL